MDLKIFFIRLQDDLEDENLVDELSDGEETESGDEGEGGEARDQKRVTWSETDSVRQFDSESEDDTDEGTLKITFRHTVEQRKKKQVALVVPNKSATSEQPAAVRNPSDIYQQFACEGSATSVEQPKSILKVKKCTTPTSAMMAEILKTDEQVSMPSSSSLPTYEQSEKAKQTAISDEVKEREVTMHQEAEGHQQHQEVVNTHRPVSRFKATRQRKLWTTFFFSLSLSICSRHNCKWHSFVVIMLESFFDNKKKY